MSEKSPDADTNVVVVIGKKSMKKIEQFAARHGLDPEEVIRELVRIETSERKEGETLH
jgi:hypothetical protein